MHAYVVVHYMNDEANSAFMSIDMADLHQYCYPQYHMMHCHVCCGVYDCVAGSHASLARDLISVGWDGRLC